jgi:ABC-2 type transport system permease protein
MQLAQSLIGLAAALLGLGVVFAKPDTLGGWQPAALLAIVVVYFLVGGLSRVVFQSGLTRFVENVRRGTLDFTLTKPVDAQLLVSVRQVEVWMVIDIGLGLVVLVVALARLGTATTPGEAAAFGLTLLAGVTIIYCFLLILATCAFWFARLDNIFNIFQSMYEAGRWPITICPPWLRAILTFLIPVGFAITFPAATLVGRLSGPALLGAA